MKKCIRNCKPSTLYVLSNLLLVYLTPFKATFQLVQGLREVWILVVEGTSLEHFIGGFGVSRGGA